MSVPHGIQNPGSRRGVTVVELLLVIAIIGVVTAIALPNINLTRYRVETAAQSLGSELLAAQRAAVTLQHDVVVSFDAAQSRISLHFDANNNGATDTGERVRNRPLGDAVTIARGGAPQLSFGPGPVSFVERRAGLPILTFHRNGSASEWGGLYITSVREARDGGHATDTRAVEVDRATGRAAWHRYTATGWRRGF